MKRRKKNKQLKNNKSKRRPHQQERLNLNHQQRRINQKEKEKKKLQKMKPKYNQQQEKLQLTGHYLEEQIQNRLKKKLNQQPLKSQHQLSNQSQNQKLKNLNLQITMQSKEMLPTLRLLNFSNYLFQKRMKLEDFINNLTNKIRRTLMLTKIMNS